MTLSEFKAWFEGYTEGLEAAPTKAQFDRIKEKVKEIDGTVTTHTVYLDRYVSPYSYYDYSRPYWTGGTGVRTVGNATLGGVASAGSTVYPGSGAAKFMSRCASNNTLAAEGAFDRHAAMHALGRAEALQ